MSDGVALAVLQVPSSWKLGVTWKSLEATTICRITQRRNGERQALVKSFEGGQVITLFEEESSTDPHYPFCFVQLGLCTFVKDDVDEFRFMFDGDAGDGMTWPTTAEMLKCPMCGKFPKMNGKTNYMLTAQFSTAFGGAKGTGVVMYNVRCLVRPICQPCLKAISDKSGNPDMLQEWYDEKVPASPAASVWRAAEELGILDACVKEVRAELEGFAKEGSTAERRLKTTLVKPTKCYNDMCMQPRRNPFAPGEALKACAKCRVSYYCCAACQHADWKRHKTVCAEVVKLKAELDAAPTAESAGEEKTDGVRRTSTASFKPLEEDDDLD